MKERIKKIIKSKKFLITTIIILIIISLAYWPSKITEYDYGVTFSSKYAKELGLDPIETFNAMTDELGIKKVRLVAYWDEIEAVRGTYDFSDLDWQMKKAEEKNLEIILTVGRRVPRWPECHLPEWVHEMTWEREKDALLDYIAQVVNRYKNYDSIIYWQVENEPFLTAYVPHICGSTLDKNFLDEEIELVRKLDPTRKILTTDSGNLGLWARAYKRGDLFGSTFYVYLANERFGEIKSRANHNFYKAKKIISQIFFGKKPIYLIEVSLEPWLVDPIIETAIDIQFESMNISRMKEILEKSAKTNFDEQYLWGMEWWYYLKKNGHPEIWEFARSEIF